MKKRFYTGLRYLYNYANPMVNLAPWRFLCQFAPISIGIRNVGKFPVVMKQQRLFRFLQREFMYGKCWSFKIEIIFICIPCVCFQKANSVFITSLWKSNSALHMCDRFYKRFAFYLHYRTSGIAKRDDTGRLNLINCLRRKFQRQLYQKVKRCGNMNMWSVADPSSILILLSTCQQHSYLELNKNSSFTLILQWIAMWKRSAR